MYIYIHMHHRLRRTLPAHHHKSGRAVPIWEFPRIRGPKVDLSSKVLTTRTFTHRAHNFQKQPYGRAACIWGIPVQPTPSCFSARWRSLWRRLAPRRPGLICKDGIRHEHQNYQFAGFCCKALDRNSREPTQKMALVVEGRVKAGATQVQGWCHVGLRLWITRRVWVIMMWGEGWYADPPQRRDQIRIVFLNMR